MNGDTARFGYQMAKAAINVLTLSIAATYGRHNIRCNAIAPGLAVAPAIFAVLPAAAQSVWRSNIPLPFIGTPEHVASVVAFLVSDEAAYVTGQVITVDGGLMSHVPHLAQFQADPSISH